MDLREIKATQGYENKYMKKFNFLKQYNLDAYQHRNKPLVMFGCYLPQDIQTANMHRGPVIILWGGVDALRIRKGDLRGKNIISVTYSEVMKAHLNRKGIKTHLIKIVARHRPEPLTMGSKIYAYLNNGKPDYHGKSVVDQLDVPYSLLIGTGSVKIAHWKTEMNSWYGQCFIGLFLSKFVGGMISIQEMGLRGIPVISNTIKQLPHITPWTNAENVEDIIREKAIHIGSSDPYMAELVYNSMLKYARCFNLGQLLIEEKTNEKVLPMPTQSVQDSTDV